MGNYLTLLRGRSGISDADGGRVVPHAGDRHQGERRRRLGRAVELADGRRRRGERRARTPSRRRRRRRRRLATAAKVGATLPIARRGRARSGRRRGSGAPGRV